MNRKQLLTLLVVLVVLGAGGILLMKKQSAAWQGGEAEESAKKLLPDLVVGEELAQFIIQHGTNEVTLLKKDDIWRVQERADYPANYSEISRAVLKLHDLKATQTEQAGPADLGRLELLPPDSGTNAGTLIVFNNADGTRLDALLLGKEQMRQEENPSQFGGANSPGYPVGRWVKNPDDDDTVALVSDPLSNLKPQPANWLDKDFFKVEKPKSISVTYPESTNSYTVERETETGPWKLDGLKAGEELDTSKTSSFSYALSSPSFTDVIPNPDAKSLGLDNPTKVVIKTFGGFTYTIKVGDKLNGDYVMTVAVNGEHAREREPGKDEKPEDKKRLDKEFADNLKAFDDKLAKEKKFEGWTYKVSSYTLDSVLKKRSELLKEKKEEKGKTDESAKIDENSLGPVMDQ